MHERRFVSWGVGLPDLDNDGFPDIFLVTGQVYPELEPVLPQYPRKGPRILFRNQGDGTFVELNDAEYPALASRHVSRGCAFGDFDNDGDLDIVIMNQNEPPSLLRNDAPPDHRWIKVRLRGTKSNRSALGCASDRAQRRESAGSGTDEPVQLRLLQRSAPAFRPRLRR